MALSNEIREILNLHRRQLFGLVEIRGVKRMRALYAEAQAELQADLAGLVRRGRGQTFSAYHSRIVLAQLTDAVRYFQGKLGEQLRQQGKVGAKLGVRQLTNEIRKLGKHFGTVTPVVQMEHAAVLANVVPGVMPSLMDRCEASRKLYGPPVIKRAREQMAISMLKGEPMEAAIDRVAGTDGIFAGERWRAERIVRTETSYAANVSKYRGMQTLQKDVPTLQKKLIETDDDREGEDSKILHGQVRDVNQPFVYRPPAGKKGYPPFMMPPGRPNDRAIVVAWRSEWGNNYATSSLGDGAPEVDPSTRGLPEP